MYATMPDGTTLFYEERGAGAPAIVFVHSLGTHEHYGHQIDQFARHHRVIAPDLAGFGLSTAPARHEFTFASWVDDLAWLLERLKAGPAVVVGHSMSGAIAMELAADHPDLVGAVVLLDPVPIVALAHFREGLVGLVRALEGPHYREAVRQFAEQRQFRATDDPELRERLIHDMCAVPQDILVAVFTNILAWDGEHVAPRVQAPILHIVQGGGMPVDLDRVRETVRGLELGQTVGAGHWAHIIDPGQVNSMIERFLAIHAPEPVGAGEASTQ